MLPKAGIKKTLSELARLKLTRALLFSAALVVIANVISSVFEIHYWQPSNTDAMYIFAYQHVDEPYDVLIIGSSHVKKGVLAQTVEEELSELAGRPVRAFNLGQRGAHILTNYAVFRDMLNHAKRPRVVVVELSPASINFNNKDKQMSLKHYCSQGDILRLLPSFRTTDEFKASLFGLFRGVTTLIDFVVRPPRLPEHAQLLEQVLAQGGGHLYKPEKDPFASYASRSQKEQERRIKRRGWATKRRRLVNYRIDGPSDRIVRRMVALSKEKEVPLVFIDLPVTREFRGFYNEGEYETFLKYAENLHVSRGVEFHNLTREYLLLPDNDFADLDHLNKRGAEKLSRHLAVNILQRHFLPEQPRNLAIRTEPGLNETAF
jgi:hypothetical protein